MKIIPKTFSLGGRDYTVSLVDNHLIGTNVAYIDFPKCTVTIANQFKGTICTQDYKESTFLHELTHGILDTLGYSKLSEDEELVEGFANLLHQYLKTAKYE